MRLRWTITLLVMAASLPACKKDAPQKEATCGAGFAKATVLHGRNLCDQNGYVIQLDAGAAYPPDSLPANLQQSGLRICLTYTLYEDPRMCACCGGTRLKIGQIQRQ
ncbi:hypothetical protein MON38_11600 [Hymenobacter sp. DH14]|uniref:Lipoprotein n=1 Tax=Hymenobacter cyanobacteriorum TaxID=2926463 RepID=A0A9X1VL26_9BACT|nr:hypothetical protein [Hymenobacter cyanobacteriorum]MCI1188066.1 hypothetical protein [Hymenobacter cyanobacteriorum]